MPFKSASFSNNKNIKGISAQTVSEISDTCTLEVQFFASGSYEYYNVPVSVYDQLVNSDNPTKLLNKLVKHKYEYKKVGN